jgi:hypothetical protein
MQWNITQGNEGVMDYQVGPTPLAVLWILIIVL